MLYWRKIIRRSLAKFGIKISRVPKGIGGNAFLDMRMLLDSIHPLIFDVGANVGQSVEYFLSVFPAAEIYSFEPSPSVFEKLQMNTAKFDRVRLWNQAFGSSNTELELLEHNASEWTSFLPPDGLNRRKVERRTRVPVTTIDDFCETHGINRIDILKSDTQGYDLEVFKGAAKTFLRGAITLVYCELPLAKHYQRESSCADLFNFLVEHGFSLVSLYDINYEAGVASWTDGLFIHADSRKYGNAT
jgi:FkbM family methyltransferase